MKQDMDMYLIIGNYTFTIDNNTHRVSKVYMYASVEQPLHEEMVNRSITNERLKMDYKRLKEAGIIVEERYL
jgi:hypothetical protein